LIGRYAFHMKPPARHFVLANTIQLTDRFAKLPTGRSYRPYEASLGRCATKCRRPKSTFNCVKKKSSEGEYHAQARTDGVCHRICTRCREPSGLVADQGSALGHAACRHVRP